MACDRQPVFTISRTAKMLDIHPQTLRLYEREGFVNPSRTRGNTRRYSPQDIDQLRLVLHLTRELGVNLAGVEIILNMQRKLAILQQEIDALRRLIAERMRQYGGGRARQYALIKASCRMLVKV